jgi:hypothetical protein
MHFSKKLIFPDGRKARMLIRRKDIARKGAIIHKNKNATS